MVNETHREYKTYFETWQLLRDTISGDDAVKAKNTTYVPRLSEQSNDDYNAMLNRPVYENYTQRILNGFIGLMFSKDPMIKLPAKLEDYKDNIDLKGTTLIDFEQELSREVMSVGRVGLLVDYVSVDTSGMSKAEAEMLNSRPYMTKYNTESIINWKYENINNVSTLTMVVLKEQKEVWTDFVSELKDFYRVLRLQEGVYIQEIYEQDEDKKSYGLTQTITPMNNGNTMSHIPFYGITPNSIQLSPVKPPLYDVAKVNLSYFQTDVDLHHGSHFTALPTAYASGVQLQENESIALGSSTSHVFPDPSAKMAYLEFEGKGLDTLKELLERKKGTMVSLGSNILQGDKNTAEAENTVAMRTSGERATLMGIAQTMSRAITKALVDMAEWQGLDSTDIENEINTDYNLTSLGANEINAIMQTFLTGGLTKRDLFEIWKKGELLRDGIEFEDWLTEMEEEAPQMSVTPERNTDNEKDSTLSGVRKFLGLD